MGVELRGSKMESRAAHDRYWTVKRATQYMLGRRRVCCGELEVLVGHAPFLALSRREVLSVFFTVYRFIGSCRGIRCELWASVKEELRAFVALMPLSSSSSS